MQVEHWQYMLLSWLNLDCPRLVSHMEMAVASVVYESQLEVWMNEGKFDQIYEQCFGSVQIKMSHFSSPFQWKSVAQERHCSDASQIRLRVSLCILHAGSYWCTSANRISWSSAFVLPCLTACVSGVCSDDNITAAQSSVAKLGMVGHHYDLDCPEELGCCLQGQGHSKGSFNPFTAPACTISGLKGARMSLKNSLVSGLRTNLFSVLWVLMKTLSHAGAKKKTKRFQHFRLCTFIGCFQVTLWQWRG